jgi:peptidoglycan/xylan/chitin deacetylase (PgdA/CDA1 family)
MRWYRRAAARRESWSKALRGQVDLVTPSKLLYERLDAWLRSTLAGSRASKPNGLATALDRLCERGTRALLVYSADDPGLDHLRAELGDELEALRRHARFSLEIIDGPDHTFSPLDSQAELARRIARHLASCHGAAPCESDASARPGPPFERLASIARRGVKRTASRVLPSSWLIVHGSRSARRLALTFDDGPTELTRAYLDVLAAHRVPASFFLVGRACERFPGAVLEIHRRGHAIGSHGFTHKNFPQLSRKQLLAELARTDRLLPAPRNGKRLVRPPHGSISPRSLFDCTSAGYSTVLWSYDSGDSHHSSKSELLEAFEREPPKSGDIILLHEDHRHTLEALNELIERLLSQGFELVTVSELVSSPSFG